MNSVYFKENPRSFDLIQREISDVEDFVLVNVKYKDEYRSEQYKGQHFIAPIEIRDDGFIRKPCCYDNKDNYGKVFMSKEQMVMEFNLNFGKTVKYEVDEYFDMDKKCFGELKEL